MSHQWIECQLHPRCGKRVFLDPSSCEYIRRPHSLPKAFAPPTVGRTPPAYGRRPSHMASSAAGCNPALSAWCCHFSAWYFSLLIAPPRYNSVARSNRACSACSASASVGPPPAEGTNQSNSTRSRLYGLFRRPHHPHCPCRLRHAPTVVRSVSSIRLPFALIFSSSCARAVFTCA